MYKFKTLSDHELKTKIRKAYAWLKTHDNPIDENSKGRHIAMAGNKWNFIPQEYDENLIFYESAVDEAKERGIDERSCWTYQDDTITVDNMTTEEVVLTMVK